MALSATLLTTSFTLPLALSVLPSRLRRRAPVRSPAACLARPLLLSIFSATLPSCVLRERRTPLRLAGRWALMAEAKKQRQRRGEPLPDEAAFVVRGDLLDPAVLTESAQEKPRDLWLLRRVGVRRGRRDHVGGDRRDQAPSSRLGGALYRSGTRRQRAGPSRYGLHAMVTAASGGPIRAGPQAQKQPLTCTFTESGRRESNSRSQLGNSVWPVPLTC